MSTLHVPRIEHVCNYTSTHVIRSSATAEGPRDALR